MKKHVFYPLLWPVLVTILALILACGATAQTYTLLYSFSNGSDGSNPSASLILSGGVLYGVAYSGGSAGEGSVFAVNTDGTSFTNVYSFTNGSDGANPQAQLILAGNTLYGTTRLGGSAGAGTIFAVNTDGTGFRTLHGFTALSANFTNGDGEEPFDGLVLSGKTLYGTAHVGGSSGNGTVFAVNTNGMGFTNLYNFTALANNTNSDGANPESQLILAGSTLYGTADRGGTNGSGTVFAVTTNGTGFTTLHAFKQLELNYSTGSFTNGDGANPYAGLILAGNTLYGTTVYGGLDGNGTVFAINTNGTGFAVLHAFTAISDEYTNGDGIQPYGGLVLSGNTLYGTAQAGGSMGDGTVFAMNTNGTGFINVLNFDDDNYGTSPTSGLTLAGNTLYGTTTEGDDPDDGTVYSLTFTLPLAISQSTTNVVLNWPTNVAGFDYTGYKLQSTTNLGPAATWVTNTITPAIVNGLFTWTNPAAGPQKFFRLASP